MMSPPSCATAGRTRVSKSSLIWETISSSSASASAAVSSPSATRNTGRPVVKCSMIAANIAGFSWYQSPSSTLLTVTKSAPRKTPATPGTAKSRSASGDRHAAAASAKCAVPAGATAQPGRNFKVAGFGVCSVWMNIARLRRDRRKEAPISLGAGGVESTLVVRIKVLGAGAQETADRLRLAQDRSGNRLRALGAAAQQTVEMTRIHHQPAHLAADATEHLDRNPGQRLLEGGEIAAGKPGERRFARQPGECRIDADQIVGFGPPCEFADRRGQRF